LLNYFRLLGCDKIANKEDLKRKFRESKSKIEILLAKKPKQINRKELMQNGYFIPSQNRSKRAYLNGYGIFVIIFQTSFRFFIFKTSFNVNSKKIKSFSI